MAYITKKNGSITRIIHNNGIELSFADIPVLEAGRFESYADTILVDL
jgi:hypothetical protein